MLKRVVIPKDKQLVLDKSACDSKNHMVNPKKNNLTTQKFRNNDELPQDDQTNNGAKENKHLVLLFKVQKF